MQGFIFGKGVTGATMTHDFPCVPSNKYPTATYALPLPIYLFIEFIYKKVSLGVTSKL